MTANYHANLINSAFSDIHKKNEIKLVEWLHLLLHSIESMIIAVNLIYGDGYAIYWLYCTI